MRISRHLEQVLAHAENRLAATGTRRPTEVLPLYKTFLKVEEHRLRLKHQAGGGGREICARRAELDRKSTRLNSSHLVISYAVFCLKKKNYDVRMNPS